MPHLYINVKGEPWKKHSYSAGNTFDQCPLKYYYQKVLGWKERDNKARFQFGKALEEAIQYHHDHDGQGAVEHFKTIWAANKDSNILTYTATEKDWATCNRMGIDMIRLYVAIQPTLPIPLGGRSVFQREYKKEVFPGDPNYGEIEDAGKLDIVVYADWEHPLLPRVAEAMRKGPYRQMIVDIKTSAVKYPDTPGIAAQDTQLRRYSWLSGMRLVAFLVFVKTSLGYKKGSDVRFLEPVGDYKPGDEGVIAKIDGDKLSIVRGDFMIAEMERIQGKKTDKNGVEKLEQTDIAKERVDVWLKQFAVQVTPDQVTKQRVQFLVGVVSEKGAEDAGLIAGRQIVSIVNASKSKQWPNTFGVRYPHDDTNDSYFKAFVMGDENFKNQNFIKTDEETLDDLFKEDIE